ncbi:MAG: 3-hydroxyacyl-CoA dehydrogenase/enoyl-CoA hydratase family protein [Planctomycetota bacterium]|nr:3-hydroxyacyl-CoA dehydrogenase/enoyl-CoA hydratase family protein [Planctomycetota bacterium]
MSFTLKERSLSKIAVIGSGQIGPDIALYFSKTLSSSGVQIHVVDIAEDALTRGKAKLEKKIAKGVETGAFTPDQQARMLEHVTFTSDYESVRGADFVVEAATEDRELKQRIFTQIEAMVSDDAILASNSSHLEPETIFAQTQHKSRTLVIHYFFPAERNPIVEIVSGADTSPDLAEWLLSFYENIGKVPVPVKSRYGYAVDPVFEGLFLASALLAEAGVGTTKQIDRIACKALGLTVGSFTAMNLTGGNPITAVGLANYNSKIHSWFRTPDSLRECLESSKPWDTPARDEEVEIPEDVEASITDTLRGAYFGLCGEIIDAGLISIADFDMALSLSLDMKPAFTFMNQLGTAEALRLVQNFADANPGFPVPKCIAERGLNNEPFNIPVIMRKDVDGIATLTIRRPKVLNALSHSVYNELRQHFSDIEEDASIRASVLTGYGKKAFVSGADVRFLAKIETVEDGERTASSSNEVMSFIENLNKPVVCAMNGLAFGGGNELAMSCTIRIAQKGLRVLAGQPEPNLGIIPGAGGTQRLPRIVGLEKAAELLRTGRPISSAEALALGLISEEVDGDLIERARDIAQDLADGKLDSPGIRREPLDNVPSALPEVDLGHLSKKVDEILCKAILGGAGMVLTDALAFEVVCFGEVCGTKDMRIGVDNFIRNGPRARAEFTHS